MTFTLTSLCEWNTVKSCGIYWHFGTCKPLVVAMVSKETSHCQKDRRETTEIELVIPEWEWLMVNDMSWLSSVAHRTRILMVYSSEFQFLLHLLTSKTVVYFWPARLLCSFLSKSPSPLFVLVYCLDRCLLITICGLRPAIIFCSIVARLDKYLHGSLSVIFKGTRCGGSVELVFQKHLKPFVMKCEWSDR